MRGAADSNTDSKRSDNLCMDTINKLKFNNGFTGYSESDFNHNIHRNRNRCERLHSIDTGDGECKSASCSDGCTAPCDLCGTADSNTYSKRSDNILVDTIHSTKFNNRFTRYCKSNFDNNILGNRNRCERL